MARLRRPVSPLVIPPGVLAYDPELHGTKDTGIRAWKAQALAWLRAHPGERLPLGEVGDVLDVLRVTARLLEDEWGPWRDLRTAAASAPPDRHSAERRCRDTAP